MSGWIATATLCLARADFLHMLLLVSLREGKGRCCKTRAVVMSQSTAFLARCSPCLGLGWPGQHVPLLPRPWWQLHLLPSTWSLLTQWEAAVVFMTSEGVRDLSWHMGKALPGCSLSSVQWQAAVYSIERESGDHYWGGGGWRNALRKMGEWTGGPTDRRAFALCQTGSLSICNPASQFSSL